MQLKVCGGVCRIKAKLEENNPDGVKPFTTGAQEEIKMIMGNMKNYQVTTSYGYISTSLFVANSATHAFLTSHQLFVLSQAVMIEGPGL